MPETIIVNKEALKEILIALVGEPHLIRELQATRGLSVLGMDNPIDTLVHNWNDNLEES